MKITHKSITLPVPVGATKEWVVAQRQEMERRLIQDIPPEVPFNLRRQWTDKAHGRFITVIADVRDYGETS